MHANQTLVRIVGAALVAVTTLAAVSGSPARADEVIAVDRTTDQVAAPGAVAAPAITAAARGPRTIVVSNHGGRAVSLYAKGERRRAVVPAGTAPVRFTGLTAGRTYVVVVGGAELGRLVAIDRPLPASGLTVRTTGDAAVVALSWRHAPSTATGGSRVWYDVTATSPTAPTLRQRVVTARSTRLTGFDPSALYSFTVTPRNGAGAGRATTARMTRPLAAPVAAAAAPAVAATPAPSATPTASAAPEQPTAPAPAPAPPASPRTVYVCPSGSTQTTSGTCVITRAYTYSTKAYTFHTVTTGPAPILDEYSTTVRACPGGYNLEDYGWVVYCRRYGAAPTSKVKDPTPAGYTDDGSLWVRKDPVPDGFVDDGTVWVRTVPKVAQVGSS